MLALHHIPNDDLRTANFGLRIWRGPCELVALEDSTIRNPKSEMVLVRQVRLELTIPCLRGRCLDPIWLLTQETFPISDCRLPIDLLAGLTRLELAISASTVQRF